MIALNPVTVILIPFYADRQSAVHPQFYLVLWVVFLPGAAENNLQAVKTCAYDTVIRREREHVSTHCDERSSS